MDGLLDNVFIDIAIAFVLTYALLALLVMKVQESLHGNLRAGRVHNLHVMLKTALMGDVGLAQSLLKNPLLFALYTSDEPRPGQWWGRTAAGPSEIPPALFARALLMQLNPSGKPPRDDGFTPLGFVDDLEKNAAADSPRGRLALAMRALVQGHDGDWAGFEGAIAEWYEAIGERARGWWKRRSSLVGFFIALLVCMVLNVDAGRIASSFGEDAELRQSFVRIAEGVQDVRDQDAAAAAAATAASVPAAPGTVAVVVDPATRAISRMVDAITRLRAAFDRDKAIRAYGFYASDFAICGKDVKAQLQPVRSASAPDEGRFLSNSDTWQTVLPLMLARMETAVRGEPLARVQPVKVDLQDDGKPIEPAQALRDAQRCVIEISAWVRAAAGVGSTAESQRLMREAAIALEDSKSALQSLLRSAEAGLNARRLFSTDPEAYADCASATVTSLAALQRCVQARRNAISRLPIGLSVSNRNAQFCRVVSPCPRNPALASVAPVAHCSAGDSDRQGWLCTGSAPAIRQIDVPAFSMQVADWTVWPAWFGGVLVSAFLVSLGAPFWFDLLSKVMRVRSSVATRDSNGTRMRGQGGDPLPVPASKPAATAGGGDPTAPSDGPKGRRQTVPRVIGAENDFEDDLTVREVQALQQGLGVSATGALDEATRAAVLARSRELGLGETRQLTAATYAALVGRPALQTQTAVTALPSGRLRKGEPNPSVPLLVKHLQARMPAFGHTINPAATTLDDDLRALCVLWRYKTDPTLPPRERRVFDQARANPAQLNEVDQALLQEIASPNAPAPLAREAQPWMDWALGELGQVEAKGASRATSNPRVVAYLDAVRTSLGDQGDVTAWCGAFVTWVLKQRAAEPGAAALAALPAVPERAANWIGWAGAGSAPSAAAPQTGDVVVINVGGGGHHVGLALASDPSTGEVWLIGGNQNNGTCVCRSRFLLSMVAYAVAPF